MAHVFRSCAHLHHAYYALVVGFCHWGFGDGADWVAWNSTPKRPFYSPSGPNGQDNVLSLRLAAFGGLGVVAGLMVQNSLDACRDPVWLGSPEFMIFTEFP